MSYEKYYPGGWQSGESGGTPITPEALNHIENGIKQTYSDFAPAGIVSKTIKIASETELDNALTEEINTMANDSARFLVFSPTNSSVFGGVAVLCRLYKRSGSGYGTADFIGYSTHGPNTCQKSWYGGTWKPIEWVNPPMALGVEYRTTERYNGKPVYAKLVDVQALPNNTTKSVEFDYTGTIKEIVYRGGSTSSGMSLPHIVKDTAACILVTTGPGYLNIQTGVDRSGLTAKIKVKYTKTTD